MRTCTTSIIGTGTTVTRTGCTATRTGMTRRRMSIRTFRMPTIGTAIDESHSGRGGSDVAASTRQARDRKYMNSVWMMEATGTARTAPTRP